MIRIAELYCLDEIIRDSRMMTDLINRGNANAETVNDIWLRDFLIAALERISSQHFNFLKAEINQQYEIQGE